jgi:hypothetical protein
LSIILSENICVQVVNGCELYFVNDTFIQLEPKKKLFQGCYKESKFDLVQLLKDFKKNLEKESQKTSKDIISVVDFKTFVNSIQNQNEKNYFHNILKTAEKEQANNELEKNARDFYQVIATWNEK